ncbi:MAG: DNA mismatch repair endonuclease MutL [bacterium]
MPETIKPLSETVADRIAAGEVIERPASVVKELLENSVDAGADEIDVEFEDGGTRRIEVKDNGSGIRPEDLPLAVQRHATSKISSAEDLKKINTLGFRGEALASIVSVADVRIVSRTADETEARELYFEDGEPAVKPAARAEGTTVIVEDLFESVPARRKFLKTERTERKHIIREVQEKALAHPGVHFRLIEDGQVLFSVPPGELKDRTAEILGEDIRETMVDVDRLEPSWKDRGRFGLSGLVSDGTITQTTRRNQFLFVNSRAVSDPVLYRAISKSYEKLGLSDDHPPVILFLSIPSEEVDVNVHPRKEKVRYDKNQVVFRFVYETIKDALQQHYQQESSAESRPMDSSSDSPFTEGPAGDGNQPSSVPRSRPGGDRTETEAPEAGASAQMELSEEPDQSQSIKKDERVLGQFRETFLVVERPTGLFLVDQHTAHERVLYEEFLDKCDQREPAQYLSVPLTLDLNRTDREFILDKIDQLEDLGLTIEEFGSGSLVVQSVPGYLGRRDDDKRMVYDMIEEFITMHERDKLSDPADDMITIMACRSAVMRGDRLMPREQNELLDSLSRLDFPGRCPHGRRIFYNVANDEISKWFERPKDDLCASR